MAIFWRDKYAEKEKRKALLVSAIFTGGGGSIKPYIGTSDAKFYILTLKLHAIRLSLPEVFADKFLHLILDKMFVLH